MLKGWGDTGRNVDETANEVRLFCGVVNVGGRLRKIRKIVIARAAGCHITTSIIPGKLSGRDSKLSIAGRICHPREIIQEGKGNNCRGWGDGGAGANSEVGRWGIPCSSLQKHRADWNQTQDNDVGGGLEG